MNESTTLTIRLDSSVKADLEALARHTSRSKSYLAAEAVAGYVSRELAIMEGLERGLADAAAGRLIDHDQAMDEIDRVIADAGRKRRA